MPGLDNAYLWSFPKTSLLLVQPNTGMTAGEGKMVLTLKPDLNIIFSLYGFFLVFFR